MLKGLARRKGLAVLMCGLAPLMIRALLLPALPVPSPRVHDEFSYLLAAHTFSRGRLVNPQHPLWVHFESMHVLVRPVYASIFPAAQGLIMAVGQSLGGHPWIGVWLSMGMMCAALCWMLQGWVPPGWALLGGSLAAVRFGVLSYWMNSYYGGAMASIGGALVLGALPRLIRYRRWRHAAILGAGVAILANSRPYEGFVFSLIAGVVLWRSKTGIRTLTPAVLILGAMGAAMGYYCSRFSGNPYTLPYSLYRNTFTMAPHFVWQSPRPEPVYHHRVLHHFYAGMEMASYMDARANRAPHGLLDKAVSYWRFYLGPFLTIPFVTLPWLWKRRRTRYLLLAAALFCAGLAVEVWHAQHYAAPATGLMLLLLIEALRQLRLWRWGVWLVRVVITGCFLFPLLPSSQSLGGGHGERRASILKQIESTGGRHLVIVRYQLSHNPGDEWAYNSADIDSSPVVWAREMDPGSNRRLMRYFAGRRVWLVEPDTQPVRLSPYDPSAPPDPPFRFVKLGTQAIEALRDPDEVKRQILERVGRQPNQFNCDQWNYFFYDVTGIEPPEAGNGCFPPGNRGRVISFKEWFGWLSKQR